jgi:hypothetical protein
MMKIACMAWPHPKHKCGKAAHSVGHGIYLCPECQESLLQDLIKAQKDKAQADADLKRLAQQMAGQKPIRPPIMPVRGADLQGGRMEENRRRH